MNKYKEVVIKRIATIVATIPAATGFASANIDFDRFTRDVYIKQIVFREAVTVNTADVAQLLTPLIVSQPTLIVSSESLMDSFTKSQMNCSVAKSPFAILLSSKCDFQSNSDQLIIKAGDFSGLTVALFNTQAGNIINPIDYACSIMIEYAYKQQL